MFEGLVTSEGDLNRQDRDKVVAALKSLNHEVGDRYLAYSLSMGQVPFIRPANFLVILRTEALYLIVDSALLLSAEHHIYLDRRDVIPVPPLEGLMRLTMQEYGFHEPIGIPLPLTALDENEDVRRQVLAPIAVQVCEKLAERARLQQLRLPLGYEHLNRFAPKFLIDHPNIEHNVFLMMRFEKTPQQDEIQRAIRDSLAQYNFIALRADDKDYTTDLWENVCLYMLGSKYGIALFEEIDKREFNPSVALELGFMLAQNKRCLILKDKRMPKMPTDIIGKLYKEFDTYDITRSITDAVHAWVRDIGVTQP